jgi:diguanylate cyclase (GGDEF)-like protein/PAS domain S-box-containing protein
VDIFMKISPKDDIRLEDVLNTTPVAVGWSSVSSGRMEYVNKAFRDLFGYTLEDIPDMESWYLRALSQPQYYQEVIEPWIKECQGSDVAHALKAMLHCKDHSLKQVSMTFSSVGDKRLWYFNDVTDYWVAEKRLRTRSEMLEMVAKSSALKDILNVIVKQIQQESPFSLCSVLLFDKANQCLKLGAAPDLPDFYNNAIDGIKIGANVGSCGTAAHLRERVIVDNIHTHRYWKNFTQLACEADVAACWSDPIMSSKGDLLGTFAIYKRFPSSPTKKDFELINFASNLASIAIENSRAQEELERRAYFDHLTGLANRRQFFEQCENVLNQSTEAHLPLAIVMMDVDHFKQVNDEYGHKAGDLALQKLAETSMSILRKEDLIARIGGEEFAILLPFTGKKEALQIADRLRLGIAQCILFGPDNEKIHITVSLGVAFKQGGHCSADELLNKADKALYRSKALGRNCVYLLED